MAKICNDVDECARHLALGNLVAFPTETVYGLGANALDTGSVLKIFQAKKRPLTDPVIVHVNSASEALPLISESDPEIIELYMLLTASFWPGPLTLVAKASGLISPILTANTGFIGIRSPKHPIAQELIRKAGVPIAAPSANLFSHVSPTTAQHVLDDFSDSLFDIKVIDGEKCSFGIESTVAKIYKENGEVFLRIFRRGGITEEDLGKVLENKARIWHQENYSGIEISSEAPGQLIKHYSPNVETFLLSEGECGDKICEVSSTVFICFNCESIQNCKAQQFLAETCDISQAVSNLYESLRWAEVQGGDCIVVALGILEGKHSEALWDRIFRATSGRKVVMSQGNVCHKL